MAADPVLSAAQRVAVVGAGWAGLAAAHELAGRGFAVTVFEASHEAGGRARAVAGKSFENASHPLDNGQHLMLGAYTDTLALMRELGIDMDAVLLRTPLRLETADGSYMLRVPRLPAPLHAAGALLGVRGLSFAARRAAFRLMAWLRLRHWHTPPGWSVAQLLQARTQPAPLVARLWRPLCLAALNTPPDQACARLFAAVLRDGLDAPLAHSDLLLPRRDLSSLWPRAAAARHDMRYGHVVRSVAANGQGVCIDGEPFAAGVLAAPPAVCARLLPDDPAMQPAVQAMQAFRYLPIATLTVRFAAPLRLRFPMLMLDEDPARGHDGQWVFDRGWLLRQNPDHGELAVVASAATALASRDRGRAAGALIEQLQEQLAGHAPGGLPAVRGWELLVDKRATFAARPGLHRPGNATAWPRLALCGDWTDTGYPATLEGAVRSGRQAGRLLAGSLNPMDRT
ncbi:15-cis-phytoene desaturase [Pigmentiphaga humi]|uniref:15-cis-phytoene desaturase n=1 Tax=Pigmentiphaga humi TaxID=2478468 RepID=A0A3P4BA58_9BURK|nr:hydroxysqualene dehydroxylase HpnE [Pigmentiphaga humi]VCU72015.1 15-cis-phytoene desaturase [Pigmentiphaga humi]